MNAYQRRQVVVMLCAGVLTGVFAVFLSSVVGLFVVLAWPKWQPDLWLLHPYKAFGFGFAAAVLLRLWVLRNVAQDGD